MAPCEEEAKLSPLVMASFLFSTIGFVISLAGAVVVAWPIVARTDTQLSVATGVRYGFNPELR